MLTFPFGAPQPQGSARPVLPHPATRPLVLTRRLGVRDVGTGATDGNLLAASRQVLVHANRDQPVHAHVILMRGEPP